MLKPLADLATRLLSLTKDTQQNKADIREVRQEIKELRQQVTDLRQEFRDLILVVQQLAFDIRRTQETRRMSERRRRCGSKMSFSGLSGVSHRRSRTPDRTRADRLRSLRLSLVNHQLLANGSPPPPPTRGKRVRPWTRPSSACGASSGRSRRPICHRWSRRRGGNRFLPPRSSAGFPLTPTTTKASSVTYSSLTGTPTRISRPTGDRRPLEYCSYERWPSVAEVRAPCRIRRPPSMARSSRSGPRRG
jgi:hypothetical protein